MANPLGNKGDGRSYEAAEDAFTSEGGYVARELGVGENPADAACLMSEFSIHYVGRHHKYIGYRYDRLVDAVGYVRLVRSRGSQEARTNPLTHDDGGESPSESEWQLMAYTPISEMESADMGLADSTTTALPMR